MGESNNAKQLANKLAGFASDVPKLNRQAVAEAAGEFKEGVLREAATVAGGDLRLSNFGRRGVKLGAGYDVKGYDNAVALLRARPQGAWKVLEYGAGPHLIGLGKAGSTETTRSKGRAYRKANRRYLKGRRYGHPVRGPIAHPGSKSFKVWSRGITTRQPRAVQRIRMAFATGLYRRMAGPLSGR
ncbi:MAG: hypothetical protein EBR82_17965 [Caulobacteraceae bacterium]|nr:hypothetical protein [Caulobacteraceae bacterium]